LTVEGEAEPLPAAGMMAFKGLSITRVGGPRSGVARMTDTGDTGVFGRQVERPGRSGGGNVRWNGLRSGGRTCRGSAAQIEF